MNCVRKLHRFGWPISFELWSSPPSSAAYLMTKRCPRPQPPVPQIPQPPSEQRGQWHVLWMMIASFSIRVTKMSYYIAIAMAKKTSSNTTTNLGCKSLQSHKFDWFWNGCPEQLTKRRKKKKRKWLNKLGEKLPKNDDVRRENTVKWADIRQLTESFHYYVENSLSLLWKLCFPVPG